MTPPVVQDGLEMVKGEHVPPIATDWALTTASGNESVGCVHAHFSLYGSTPFQPKKVMEASPAAAVEPAPLAGFERRKTAPR